MQIEEHVPQSPGGTRGVPPREVASTPPLSIRQQAGCRVGALRVGQIKDEVNSNSHVAVSLPGTRNPGGNVVSSGTNLAWPGTNGGPGSPSGLKQVIQQAGPG